MFPSIDPNGGILANAVYCLARNCIRTWARMNIIDEHSLGHMCRAHASLGPDLPEAPTHHLHLRLRLNSYILPSLVHRPPISS
ncbi:BQ5605_C022g09570 [Microbotryum silenes-dioicae]|uniref:BQ5605_C022g09570 protein n=1 Tax=Microbotryum silenes-dioicae TaxID=796604 RepID=A0A2X0MNL4_9BASI|nr:BQ5605_C022g09570 [Microbotryum silenes-dioicae]